MCAVRNKIHNILIEGNTRTGRFIDLFIQFLIIFSIITFSIETVPDLSPAICRALQVTELIVVVLFTIEYILRIYVSKLRIRYIFSFFGLVDILAILPFYLALGVDLRAIRIFRMLRLFRILKLAKYNKALSRFSRAINIAKEELIIFGFVTAGMLYISALGIYFFEHKAQPEAFKSVFHSLWWAVTTLTTVGYGDMFPITVGGKIFTFVILMVGLGVVAVPTGLIAAALSQVRDEESDNDQ